MCQHSEIGVTTVVEGEMHHEEESDEDDEDALPQWVIDQTGGSARTITMAVVNGLLGSLLLASLEKCVGHPSSCLVANPSFTPSSLGQHVGGATWDK